MSSLCHLLLIRTDRHSRDRNQRLVTLSHFSQAIYLLFSAVYVCKESIEHVLLLHGPNEVEGSHGVGHGGMGHGEGLASISNDAAIG